MAVSKNTILYISCFAIIIIFCVATLAALSGSNEFGGSDDAGGEVAAEYGYEPWTGDILTIITGNPDFELPGETESMLFAVQAAIGALIIGFFMGYIYVTNKMKKEQEQQASA